MRLSEAEKPQGVIFSGEVTVFWRGMCKNYQNSWACLQCNAAQGQLLIKGLKACIEETQVYSLNASLGQQV